MDPIVSPWIIYGIEMLTPLNFLIGGLFAAFALMSACIPFTDCYEDNPQYSNKMLWRLLVPAVILGILFVLLPSRETGYKILAASYVTTDNIRAVGGATNEAIDSILDSVVKHMNEVKK